MKRVVCLYRVSTVGQVDHDDIPMQKLACREYAATHPDWEIIDDISEKGISGYKISTNARDAIIEIKKRAVLRQFDVLLVFMFDRLGRREDETPFVVQWFVQQGIEVWSTREGEQRFDTHVDKLLNYIRFWQASGESEKTAIRVRTKHLQMVQEGHYRGGLVPYGYRLTYQGRTNKKNQPVQDLEIDKDEAAIVREIFHLLCDEGYGTNRVAQYLNDRGIKTKRGTTLWRGSSVRALINNPIYIGVLRFGEEQSAPFEHLAIIDEALFNRCALTVKGRATKVFGSETPVPLRTDTHSLLSGIIFCADCGSRMAFNRHKDKKKLADGTVRVYERDLYRCYRKVSSRNTCNGQTTYKAEPIHRAVEGQVKAFLNHIAVEPRENLLALAAERSIETYRIAAKQVEKEWDNAQKQLNALEEEAIKALTGESRLDLDVLNTMLVKHRAKLKDARTAMEEAESALEQEKESREKTSEKIDELLSWAACYDRASVELKHMIICRLIDRVEVSADYQISIHFRISLEQFLCEQTATICEQSVPSSCCSKIPNN